MNINISKFELYEELLKIRDTGVRVISQPLGFYRIFITARDALSPGIMLHAWLDDTQPRQSDFVDIHSHTFEMTSRVLVGELVNEIYQVIPDRSGDYKKVNVFHDGVNSKRVVSDELVRAELISSERVRENQKYSFGSKIFHCTTIKKYPTITLMRKTNMISDNAINIIRADYNENEIGEYFMPSVDQDLIWEKILYHLNRSIK